MSVISCPRGRKVALRNDSSLYAETEKEASRGCLNRNGKQTTPIRYVSYQITQCACSACVYSFQFIDWRNGRIRNLWWKQICRTANDSILNPSPAGDWCGKLKRNHRMTTITMTLITVAICHMIDVSVCISPFGAYELSLDKVCYCGSRQSGICRLVN